MIHYNESDHASCGALIFFFDIDNPKWQWEIMYFLAYAVRGGSNEEIEEIAAASNKHNMKSCVILHLLICF